jgi:hypothetical protein
VPRVLVWDGEGAVGRWRAGRVELTAECHAFRGTLGAKVLVCKPADPEAKGLIERAHGYLETSFLPGRTFASATDFNIQLQQWLAVVNARQRRALGCAPTDRITADRAARRCCVDRSGAVLQPGRARGRGYSQRARSVNATRARSWTGTSTVIS